MRDDPARGDEGEEGEEDGVADRRRGRRLQIHLDVIPGVLFIRSPFG